jgi:hypothetical protein
LPEADRQLFVAHIAVADAVCYLFGYAGVIIFCTTVAPFWEPRRGAGLCAGIRLRTSSLTTWGTIVVLVVAG